MCNTFLARGNPNVIWTVHPTYPMAAGVQCQCALCWILSVFAFHFSSHCMPRQDVAAPQLRRRKPASQVWRKLLLHASMKLWQAKSYSTNQPNNSVNGCAGGALWPESKQPVECHGRCFLSFLTDSSMQR